VAVQRQAHGRSPTDAEVGFGAAIAASDLDDLSFSDMDRIAELARRNFGVEEEPAKYKGTMQRTSG